MDNEFINTLDNIHEHTLGLPIEERFMMMGKKTSFLSFLNSYGEDCLPENSFIGMNIRTSKVIPFFVFKNENGEEAGPEERGKMLATLNRITADALKPGKKGFLSFPEILEQIKFESLHLVIRKVNGVYDLTIKQPTKLWTGALNVELSKIKEQIEGLVQSYSASFIDSWYYSIPRNKIEYKDSAVDVQVQVSDPDIHGVGNSFFLIITPEGKSDPFVIANNYYIPLLAVVGIIKSIYIDDINKLVKTEAIKSAVAAIMSRNMSHNLGSHYLYYTKAHLESLASRVNSEISPDIRGAAKVLSYMQARMDYLATIISNDKYPYGPVNFKSQLYDELTIDDFSKRHFEFGKNDKGDEGCDY